MAEEELLKLFEQNWSEKPIFKRDKHRLNLNERSQESEEKEEQEVVKDLQVSFSVERAMSDETMISSSKTSLLSSSTDDLFLSPRSVLTRKASPMKLQTILSGKEVREFAIPQRERIVSEKNISYEASYDSEKEEERKKKKSNVRTRRGKSMSDLEYEELKGFMDLGFVFSEEDNKDSELVSILPGLQRLSKNKVDPESKQPFTVHLKNEDDKIEQVTEEGKNRPYLSEAWDQSGGRKWKRSSKMEIKWSVNEVELKDHLKLWAHKVASTIQ